MAHRKQGSAFDDAMELLIENGFDSMADVLRILLNEAMKKQVTDDIADIFAAPDGRIARTRLKQYVEKYAESAPELSEWMEENLLEGLTVFELPTEHRRRMRTTNSLERLHEEINRRQKSAVKTQVWIAISVYVLVAIIRKELKLERSLHEILQILSILLFEKTPLKQALRGCK